MSKDQEKVNPVCWICDHVNEELKAKLIDFAEFIKSDTEVSISSPRLQVEFYWQSINFLEAKPKTLHSMKCDGRFCGKCGEELWYWVGDQKKYHNRCCITF